MLPHVQSTTFFYFSIISERFHCQELILQNVIQIEKTINRQHVEFIMENRTKFKNAKSIHLRRHAHLQLKLATKHDATS